MPTTMNTKEHVNADHEEVQDFKKSGVGVSNAERLSCLRNYQLRVLTPPGRKPIKMVELFCKWRPFVPQEFQDIICPEPPAEVMEKIRKERSEKAKARKRKD